MSSYRPRMSIPDSWAQLGACPICDERTLSVNHYNGKPDRLSCDTCQVTFEMEMDGPNIRLMQLPPKYAAYIQPAWQTWMNPFEIRAQIKSATAPTPQPSETFESPASASRKLSNFTSSSETSIPSLFSDDIQYEPLTQDEVSKRAAGLASLGNSDKEIKETLERFNATPEQIDHAMAFISAQKKTRKSNTPRTIIYVLLALAICLGAAALILPLLNISKNIDAIRPVWNTLQRSFSSSSLYGGITGAELTATPSSSNGLPVDGKTYFDSVWNLSQIPSWIDKYNVMAQLSVPQELSGIHSQVLEQMRIMAIFEAENTRNTNVYNELCVTAEDLNSTPCNVMKQSTDTISLDFERQAINFGKWWPDNACSSYQSYYSNHQVIWPWESGKCVSP
jgi:hypothetical protein